VEVVFLSLLGGEVVEIWLIERTLWDTTLGLRWIRIAEIMGLAKMTLDIPRVG
jgi:hypothetical protein